MNSSIGWRRINVEAAPFSLPRPDRVIQENSSHACRGRIVGLFDLEAWHCP
jgi:hypothetical protein